MVYPLVYPRIGVWAEGSAFWLQIEIKGFEFPGLLVLYIIILYLSIKDIEF